MMTQDDQEAWLLAGSNIANPKNSEILSYPSLYRERACADLANAVVKAYLDEVVNEEQDLREQKIKNLKMYDLIRTDAERQTRESLEELQPNSEFDGSGALTLKQQIELTQSQQVKTELAELGFSGCGCEAKLDVEKRLAALRSRQFQSDELEMLLVE